MEEQRHDLTKLLLAKLLNISNKLMVKKDIKNEFGGFKYRSLEGIYEKLKPLLKDNGCYILFKDRIECIQDRYYYCVECRFYSIDIGTEVYLSSYGYARETLTRSKMDEAQITGSCSSYAKKYAISNLFLLDDGENEIDSLENKLKIQDIINEYIQTKDAKEFKNKITQYSYQIKNDTDKNILKDLYKKVISNIDYKDELKKIVTLE